MIPRALWLLIVCVICALPRAAYANPVSFKDGWAIMPSYGGDWSDLQVNYSPTARLSFGPSEYYREGEESSANFGIGQINYLLKRWNELDSQGNLYASLGVGGRHDSLNNDGFAGYGALEANYETRRIYTLASAESLQSGQNVHFTRLRARAGISPYKAPLESLQSWLIVQLDYMPEMQDPTRVTPLVRFFYNNYALEVGSSTKGTLFLAAMSHF